MSAWIAQKFVGDARNNSQASAQFQDAVVWQNIFLHQHPLVGLISSGQETCSKFESRDVFWNYKNASSGLNTTALQIENQTKKRIKNTAPKSAAQIAEWFANRSRQKFAGRISDLIFKIHQRGKVTGANRVVKNFGFKMSDNTLSQKSRRLFF
jgi:hypothetical protein